MVGGRFEWRRNRLLAVLGGDFYYETLTLCAYRDLPIVWVERDEQQVLLVNLRMITGPGSHRTIMRNNDWVIPKDAIDVESPPSGRLLHVRFPNGDFAKIEIFVLASVE